MCLAASVTWVTGFDLHFLLESRAVGKCRRCHHTEGRGARDIAELFFAAGVMENGRDSGAVPHADGFGPMTNSMVPPDCSTACGSQLLSHGLPLMATDWMYLFSAELFLAVMTTVPPGRFSVALSNSGVPIAYWGTECVYG